MRCLECDYPLWNLKARSCPECGAAFKPSEREFVVNSVKFCCPHCDTAYYGDGPNGHLQPRRFACVTCGADVDLDDMVLRPAEGVADVQTQVDRLPWAERRDIGFAKAWFSTMGLAMIGPNRLVRTLGENSSPWQAMWYAVFTFAIFCLTGGTSVALAFAAFLWSSTNPAAVGFAILGVVSPVLGAAFVLVAIVLWALVTHGMLKVTGGCSFGLGRTVEAISYGIGTTAILAVPCIGALFGYWIGAIWWIVAAVLMVASAQRVHGGRATLAVLTFPVISVIVLVVLYIVTIIMFMAGAANAVNAAGISGMTPIGQTRPLVDAFNEYVFTGDGTPPAHALEFLADGTFGVENFVLFETMTFIEDVKVGETSVADIPFLGENRRRMVIDEAIESLPEDVVAHRVGDFVFTWHGIDLDTAPIDLWLIVMWPDPDANPPLTAADSIVFCTANRNMLRVSPQDFEIRLEVQNQLRAEVGLPPLPPLDTVTNDQPAVAP